MQHIQLKFLGGAGTVTGSKILLSTEKHTVLIDCGLFQGLKSLRELNWEKLPEEINNVDAILLTHAHLDHVGFLPVLIKNGYKNPIYATAPTVDIAELILKDSAKIQEEDAEAANKYNYTKHKPAKALYTVKNVEKTMPLFIAKNYGEWVILNDEMKFCFKNNGHILGSVFIELVCNGKKFVFSGDMGRTNPLFLKSRDVVKKADYLILESTYGNRIHSNINPKDELADVIQRTVQKGGNVIIPSFVIERAQELLILLHELRDEGRIPNIPIFLDSPMGVDFTALLCKYRDWHTLSTTECQQIYSNTTMVKNFEDSQKTVVDRRQKIIIAGSGMVTGGRILHYLEKYIGDSANTILLVGHQAMGTRGKALKDGAHEIKFHGKFFPVKAEILNMTSLSAHADQAELINWIKNIHPAPKNIFLNHGEPDAAEALRVKIQSTLNWKCEVAAMYVTYKI